MKIQLKDQEKVELSTVYRELKLEAPDGKMRGTDYANKIHVNLKDKSSR